MCNIHSNKVFTIKTKIEEKAFGVRFGIIMFLHSIKPLAMGFMEIKPQLGSTYLSNARC
jgi:hypothetical protein